MQQGDANGSEKYMTPKSPGDDTDAHRIRSPITTAMISLAIYIAMYLTVAGVVRVLTPRDPAAVAPDSATAPASTATASNHAVVDDSPSRHDGASSTDGYRIQYTE